LDSAAEARAVGCGAPARDDFSAGGIGRRRFGRQDWEAVIWASGVPGTSLWQRLLVAPGGGAVVARGACVSGKGKGARDEGLAQPDLVAST